MQQAHTLMEKAMQWKQEGHRVDAAAVRRSVLRNVLEEMDKYFLAGAKSEDLCIMMQSHLAKEILDVTSTTAAERLFGVELVITDKIRAVFSVALKKERTIYERLATQ